MFIALPPNYTINKPSRTKAIEKKCREILDILKSGDNRDPSLFCGNTGTALFYAYAARFFNDPSLQDSLSDALEAAWNSFESENPQLSFSAGHTGICWTFGHLVQHHLLDADVSVLFSEIEPFLLRDAQEKLAAGNFDFMHGGLGFAVHLLDRQDAFAKTHLSEVIELLSKKAIIKGDTVKWADPATLGNPEQEYDLGLSHGIPSITWFLSQCIARNIEKEKSTFLLNGAISWLLQQKNPAGSISVFPMKLKDSASLKDSKLGWCYGDTGIASVLWQAGNIMGNNCWKHEAIDTMLIAANRKRTNTETAFDAGLCHGAAGIAHQFNRFYAQTKISAFKDAADYWIDETLHLANFTDGLAGYKAWDSDAGWTNEYGLLEGISGIGLAMLGFISGESRELSWDRCLLLS